VQGDDGISLVLALIFILLVSLFVSVALEKNQATSLAGGAVRQRTQLQYTLDGGVDRALQVLRDEMVGGAPVTCTSPISPDGTGSLSLNGQTADYTCTTLAGRAAVASDAAKTNYALVTTSTSPGALISQSGTSQDLQIAGSMFLNAKVVNGDVGKPIEISSGDLVSPQSATCNSELTALAKVTLSGAGQLRSCTEQTLAQSLPKVDLPPAPQVDLSPLLGSGVTFTSGSLKCTAYYPGRYSSPPILGSNSKNYFVSGLYYFNWTGTWTIDDANTEVVAGQRADSTDSAVPSNDCAAMGMDDAMALAGPLAPLPLAVPPPLTPATFPENGYSYGSTWVFGGTAGLDVKKGSITLFSPPAGGSTVPVSLVGASTYTHVSYTTQPIGTPTLTGGGNNSAMVVNGKVFAPNSYVEIFSTNNTVAAAQGGVVANTVQLKASAAGSDALVISANSGTGNPPPPFRTVRIETRDATSTSSARHRAIATISNFSPYTVSVRSWRTA